jgi:transposase
MKGLTLNQTEQARLATFNLVLEKQITVKQASKILKLSERHTWRMLSTYKKEGAKALAHGNRTRLPWNAMSAEIKDRIKLLAQTDYVGLNHTHLTEMLLEKNGISVSRSTVRNILVNAGIPSRRHRRPPKYRCRRPRMPHEGMLIQIDGSTHDWLEGRGSYLTLLLAVDDATGMVPYAIFREQEDTDGYFLLIEGIIRQHGIPMAIYTDQHAVFKQSGSYLRDSNSRRSGPTQFSRAMKELGIALIVARSPQAKGRVEKMGSTFQDRLVSELRMAKANNIWEANSVLANFIPRFNARFGLLSLELKHVYRSASQLDLGAILCCRYSHMVARDNTIRHQGLLLQLLADTYRRSYAGYRVELRQYPDGRMEIISGDHLISFQNLPQKSRYFSANMDSDGSSGVPMPDWLENILKGGGNQRRLLPSNTSSRYPTPRQQALWESVQTAKREGLPILRIAKALGITRETVRRYMAASSPPLYPSRVPKRKEPETAIADKIA